MSSLKNLVTAELSILSELLENGGEITPELNQKMALSEIQLPSKIDSYSGIMNRIDLEITHLIGKKDEIDQIIKGLKNSKKWLQLNLKEAMGAMDTTEILGNETRVKLVTGAPSVDVFDLEKVPAQFVREKVSFEPDKVAIKEALKAGKDVPGARLLETQYPKFFLGGKNALK